MDFRALAWIVAIVALALCVLGFVYWLNKLFLKKRLLRCPEAGCVAFVEARHAFRASGKTAELTVRVCELWPDRKDCARGCLARYDEAAPDHRIKLDALRPFEQ